MDDPTFLSFLLRLVKKHHLERWVLFPMQDEAVEFVACHTQQLAVLYQLVTQEWEIVRWANDKRQTYRMAQEVGIPYPRTWYYFTGEDLPEIQEAFPVIIKPAISTRLQYAMRLKALAARDYEELRTQYHLATTVMPAEEIMVQEVIPGNGQSQYSVATFCK